MEAAETIGARCSSSACGLAFTAGPLTIGARFGSSPGFASRSGCSAGVFESDFFSAAADFVSGAWASIARGRKMLLPARRSFAEVLGLVEGEVVVLVLVFVVLGLSAGSSLAASTT